MMHVEYTHNKQEHPMLGHIFPAFLHKMDRGKYVERSLGNQTTT